MRILAPGLAVAGIAAVIAMSAKAEDKPTYEVQRYTVYCADDRIEVSMWDLEQMKVRRGSDVCQFQSYTSYSDALTFAKKNFGGEGASCSC